MNFGLYDDTTLDRASKRKQLYEYKKNIIVKKQEKLTKEAKIMMQNAKEQVQFIYAKKKLEERKQKASASIQGLSKIFKAK